MQTALAVLLCSLGITATSSAALTIVVDPTKKEYFLSGFATGEVFDDGGEGKITWHNDQPMGGGGVVLLDGEFFSEAGSTPFSEMTIFLHVNGNVNGATYFSERDQITLTANSAYRREYSLWDEAGAIEQLESKAAIGEVVTVISGSQNFQITFRTIPEPSSAALIALAGAGFIFRRRV